MNQAIKIIIVGDSGVGKSSLLYSYIYDEKCLNPVNTIGIDCMTKSVFLNNKNHKLVFWDTAGQEKFWSISKSYYRNSQIILLVFAIDERSSFTNLSNWLNLINKTHSEDDNLISVIIGNKSDCQEEREVSHEEAKLFADKHFMSYYEVSNNEPEKISQCINLIINEHLLLKNKLLGTPPDDDPNLLDLSGGQSEYCCY